MAGGADQGNYTLVFYRDTKVRYDGKTWSFGKGDTWSWSKSDPCYVLGFVRAATVQNHESLDGDAQTQRTLQELNTRCQAKRRAAGDSTPPPTPGTGSLAPPATDPSATGTDGPPPAGQPSATELNAPQTNTVAQAAADAPAPGTVDGARSLGSQYHDPQHPVSAGDVADYLSSQGATPEQVQKGVQDARHNAPPKGQPHPDHSRPLQRDQPSTADPVWLFSGQFVLDLTDVSIPSRGLPLRFRRVYRSGPVAFGPLGYNWDHEYNRYARPLEGGAVAVWTGEIHEDVFRPRGGVTTVDASTDFEPPVGVFQRLQYRAAMPGEDEAYILTRADDVSFTFSRPPGWPLADRLPLSRIDDGHGNVHYLAYDPEGRVAQVSDEDGRYLALSYDDRGLLATVTDHTGRAWRYAYEEEIEHLAAVTTPAVTQFPDGITTRYRYLTQYPHPALRHALVAVVDGLGETVAENEYGSDPASDDWNRVVRQVYGGYEATFTATGLQYVWPDATAINQPALRVETVDPGILHVYTFNYRGNLLDHRYRLALDGTWRLHAEVFRCDEQGNLAESYGPNGLGMRRVFDTANPDPRARGNLLQVWRLAPPTSLAADREVLRLTYESRHNRIQSFRDEAGAVTTLVYDYEVSTVDRGDVVEVRHPQATLPDGSTQTSTETFHYDDRGHLVERASGEGSVFRYTYATAGIAAGYLVGVVRDATGTAVSETYTYDAWGRRETVTDGRGNSTRYHHDALGHLVRVVEPAVGGSSAETRFTYRADGRVVRRERPRGSYSDPVIHDDFIADTYDYDVLGHRTGIVYGANTAEPRAWKIDPDAEGRALRVADPLGRVSRFRYDERGCLLEQRLGPDGGAQSTWSYSYSRNGRRLTLVDPAGVRLAYAYDAWDRLSQVVLPGGTTSAFVSGSRDQLESVTVTGPATPGGPPMQLLWAAMHYDERQRCVRHANGAFVTEAWYDRDNRLSRTVDQRGAATDYTHDGEGRLLLWRDALGNERHYTYDAAGNTAQRTLREQDPGAAMPTDYVTHFAYDERNRRISASGPLGVSLGFEWDDRDLPVALTAPLGQRIEERFDLDGHRIGLRALLSGTPVASAWQRDAAGRVVAFSDPDGNTTRFTYDQLDTPRSVTYPDGSQALWQTDAAGRASSLRSPGGTGVALAYGADGRLQRLSFTPGAGVAPTAELQLGYDGLGRTVQVTQGAETVTRAFDDHDRLLRETVGGATASLTYDDASGTADRVYPDGRVDRVQTDLLGRLASVTLRSPGATGLPSGTPLVTYQYAGSDRLWQRALANGTQTRYRYDGGRRPVLVRHTGPSGDLAVLRYVYDARNLVRLRHDGSGAALYGYDDLWRLTSAAYGLQVPAPPDVHTQADADTYIASLGSPTATVADSFLADPADGRLQDRYRDGSGVRTHDYTLNELLQIVRDGTTPFAYDGDGRLVADDHYRYTYDAQGHLVRIDSISGGGPLLQVERDPMGRPRTLTDASGTRHLVHAGAYLLQEDGVQYTAGLAPDDVVLRSGGASSAWLHPDLLGSLICASDAGGQALERYGYRAFGQPSIWAPDGTTARSASAIGLGPRFAGRPQLGAALHDLYDLRARVYDAQTGRFLQRDPAGYAASPNLYAYVGLSPASFTDPDGECVVLIALGIGALIGGVAAYVRKPDAGFWDVLEGAVVGAGVGALSAVTFGAVGDALATYAVSSGGATVLANAAAGAAAGAAGGTASGAYWGGRQAYTRSGGDWGATLRGAGSGALRGGATGTVGGAIGGAALGGLWAGAVRAGALPVGAAEQIEAGAAAPRALFSPASPLGTALVTGGSGLVGSVADTGADDVYTAATGDGRYHSFEDYAEAGAFGFAGGAATAWALRYAPGTQWNDYADQYDRARTQEGMEEALRAERNARRNYWRHRGERANGREAHHQRARAGYPELADREEQLTPLPSRAAHTTEHARWGSAPNPFYNISHGPWTPPYPGTYFQYHAAKK